MFKIIIDSEDCSFIKWPFAQHADARCTHPKNGTEMCDETVCPFIESYASEPENAADAVCNVCYGKGYFMYYKARMPCPHCKAAD